MKAKFLLVISVLFLTMTSCEKEVKSTEPTRLQGPVFGTTYNIIYYDVATNFNTEIQVLFDQVNQSMSTYIPTSDISRINKGETGIKVDDYFQEVFSKSAKIFKETDGYFDPTVGNLVNAWGFGPEKPLNDLDSVKVKELMTYVGFDKVAIENGEIVKQYPEIYFDFNAVAKGFGIDVIARFLESKGVKNYLVEIGGEIRTRGEKPENKSWTVQIESPNTDGTRSAYDVLPLKDKSMASSGNYRKFRITESGEKYVHTINPKTGYAKESNLLAATVIAEMDCANVDAYATAFMAMGLEKTQTFLSSKPELKVILIYVDEKGALKEYRN
jgi:thiamine biosynthesis lipoprotein